MSITVTFASNEGGGRTQTIVAPNGITVSDFVRQHMGHFDQGRHQVSVNRQAAGPGDILTEQDHIAVMPAKVGGGV